MRSTSCFGKYQLPLLLPLDPNKESRTEKYKHLWTNSSGKAAATDPDGTPTTTSTQDLFKTATFFEPEKFNTDHIHQKVLQKQRFPSTERLEPATVVVTSPSTQISLTKPIKMYQHQQLLFLTPSSHNTKGDALPHQNSIATAFSSINADYIPKYSNFARQERRHGQNGSAIRSPRTSQTKMQGDGNASQLSTPIGKTATVIPSFSGTPTGEIKGGVLVSNLPAAAASGREQIGTECKQNRCQNEEERAIQDSAAFWNKVQTIVSYDDKHLSAAAAVASFSKISLKDIAHQKRTFALPSIITSPTTTVAQTLHQQVQSECSTRDSLRVIDWRQQLGNSIEEHQQQQAAETNISSKRQSIGSSPVMPAMSPNQLAKHRSSQQLFSSPNHKISQSSIHLLSSSRSVASLKYFFPNPTSQIPEEDGPVNEINRSLGGGNLKDKASSAHLTQSAVGRMSRLPLAFVQTRGVSESTKEQTLHNRCESKTSSKQLSQSMSCSNGQVYQAPTQNKLHSNSSEKSRLSSLNHNLQSRSVKKGWQSELAKNRSICVGGLKEEIHSLNKETQARRKSRQEDDSNSRKEGDFSFSCDDLDGLLPPKIVMTAMSGGGSLLDQKHFWESQSQQPKKLNLRSKQQENLVKKLFSRIGELDNSNADSPQSYNSASSSGSSRHSTSFQAASLLSTSFASGANIPGTAAATSVYRAFNKQNKSLMMLSEVTKKLQKQSAEL